MKYVFILNIFTLGDTFKVLYKKIDRICKNKNIDYEIECNSKDINTEDIVKKYKKKQVILLPVGGDGMINRVINSMDIKNNKICPIPYGTGNDLCRSIKTQLKDGFTKIDLIKINKKYFINNACFGIDANIANSSIISNKKIPKSMRYIVSTINSLFKYKLNDYVININNEIINGTKSTIIVCNGNYYGGGYKISPHSKLNNGYVDVYIADKMSKIKILILILGINKGKHEDSKKIRRIRCNKLLIESNKIIDANIDGETISSKKFNIEVIKDGIELYYNYDLVDTILH